MTSEALETLRRRYREHPTPLGTSVTELRASVPNTPPIAHTTITPALVTGPGASAPGPDQTPAEWVLARGADPNRRILYLHGGGYCVASPSTFRNFTSRLSAAAGMAVLAIATLVKIRDLGDRQANAAIAISPWTDLTLSGKSWQSRKDLDVWIRRDFTEQLIDWVLPNGGRNQPLISPVFANLEDLPPLYLIAGDHEVMRDDTTRLAALGRMMNVDVTAEIYPEMLHIFPIFPRLPEAREAMEKMGRFLRTQVPASWPEQDAPALEGGR